MTTITTIISLAINGDFYAIAFLLMATFSILFFLAEMLFFLNAARKIP